MRVRASRAALTTPPEEELRELGSEGRRVPIGRARLTLVREPLVREIVEVVVQRDDPRREPDPVSPTAVATD